MFFTRFCQNINFKRKLRNKLKIQGPKVYLHYKTYGRLLLFKSVHSDNTRVSNRLKICLKTFQGLSLEIKLLKTVP